MRYRLCSRAIHPPNIELRYEEYTRKTITHSLPSLYTYLFIPILSNTSLPANHLTSKSPPAFPLQIIQHTPQRLHRHGFRQKQIHARTKSLLSRIRIRCAGERNECYGREVVFFLVATNVLRGFDAGHDRHRDVHEHDIEFSFTISIRIESLQPVRRGRVI